jgi:formylglycine-generating enzyme
MRQSIARNLFRNAALALLALLAAFAGDARAVTMSWSPVGNLGNAMDPATGSLFGAVGYSYTIGTYDVTTSQYAEFLNAKVPTGDDSLALYNNNSGISFNFANPEGSMYRVISDEENLPINNITWFNAARFVNWMSNGQGDGDTESGTYTLLGGSAIRAIAR